MVKIDPVSGQQLNRGASDPQLDVPFNALEHDLTSDLMGWDFRSGQEDEPYRFEVWGADDGAGFFRAQKGAERAKVDTIAGCCMLQRHSIVSICFNLTGLKDAGCTCDPVGIMLSYLSLHTVRRCVARSLIDVMGCRRRGITGPRCALPILVGGGFDCA